MHSSSGFALCVSHFGFRISHFVFCILWLLGVRRKFLCFVRRSKKGRGIVRLGFADDFSFGDSTSSALSSGRLAGMEECRRNACDLST